MIQNLELGLLAPVKFPSLDEIVVDDALVQVLLFLEVPQMVHICRRLSHRWDLVTRRDDLWEWLFFRDCQNKYLHSFLWDAIAVPDRSLETRAVAEAAQFFVYVAEGAAKKAERLQVVQWIELHPLRMLAHIQSAQLLSPFYDTVVQGNVLALAALFQRKEKKKDVEATPNRVIL